MSFSAKLFRSLTKCACFAIVAVALVAVSPSVEAEEGSLPLPRHRLVYENLLVVRYNSLGAEEIPALTYRLRLFNKTGPMWEDAHFGVRFQPTVNFSQSRLGPSLVIKPIGVFSLFAGYYYNVWYGTFGNIRSYSSPQDDYFVPDDFSGDDTAYASSGHEVEIGARVAAVLGPFVFSNITSFYWTAMALEEGDRVYFQPRHDMPVENNGWFLTNDTDLGFIAPIGLTAAVRTSVVHGFYSQSAVENPTPGIESATPTVRLGPLLSYVFFDEPLGAFNKPTLILMASWWLKNRYRTGEPVNQGLPLVVLAFKFEGDIWWRD